MAKHSFQFILTVNVYSQKASDDLAQWVIAPMLGTKQDVSDVIQDLWHIPCKAYIEAPLDFQEDFKESMTP